MPRYPDSAVFYRDLTLDYPVIVRGEGCWLYDDKGERYLDAVGGAFVVNIGHGVREIADAMARQASRIAYVNSSAFTHEAVEELSTLLIERTPAFDKAYFLCSGSEVTEAALKLARQHWLARGEPTRNRVIALKPSYHGNTLLALSASAREHYRTYFGDWLVDVARIPAPDPYRCGCGGSGRNCANCSGDVLADTIARLGANTIAAFIAEPIGGSSSGAVVPNADYWPRVREICDRTGVLFIADEILCGAGRTGTWTAIETWGVAPDIMTLGKGIASGYAALSAVLTTERVIDPIVQSGKSFVHAQTFSHHPIACAAGVATVGYIEEHRLVERCAEMGRVFHGKLSGLRGLPHVGDIRGRGLLAAVEFVADVDTREPFARSEQFAERFTNAARAGGLIVWPNIGHVDGERGDTIMLAPPFVVSAAELDELTQRFSSALEATVGSAPVRSLGASTA
ncbi:MAG TPA: aspartate aminotransferase family protein [Gemmatimonadaceae bacterium]|nr:aspartate aminotransferase family protein [Gemmatimonadaceae bacterium]